MKIIERKIDERKLYCYSHRDFNAAMIGLGATREHPVPNISTISIVSKYDDDNEHFFSDSVSTNLNLDFCDTSIDWWHTYSSAIYDKLYDEYCVNGKDDMNPDHDKFAHSDGDNVYYSLNYEQADKIVGFIEEAVSRGDSIYVHCSAGKSRSQAIVRYIKDVYSSIHWITRKENPCIYPNWHVVCMLIRMYYNKYFTENELRQRC